MLTLAVELSAVIVLLRRASVVVAWPRAVTVIVLAPSTLGEWPAFIALWCYWISCWITNSALAVGVVGYLGNAIPSLAAQMLVSARMCGTTHAEP